MAEVSTVQNLPAPFIEAAGKTFLEQLQTAIGDAKGQDLTKLFGPQFVAGPGALTTEYVGYAYQVKSANPNQMSAPAGGIIQNATAFNFGYAMSLNRTMIGTR